MKLHTLLALLLISAGLSWAQTHGLRKPENMKDYTVRMKEFYDMKNHLEERTKEVGKPAATPASATPGAGAQ